MPRGNTKESRNSELNPPFKRRGGSKIYGILEIILAYRYERSSEAYKSDAGATTIVVGPAPVQPETEYAHYAPQEYDYGLATTTQPASDVPAMTARTISAGTNHNSRHPPINLPFKVPGVRVFDTPLNRIPLFRLFES
jgi:hypothetical protein